MPPSTLRSHRAFWRDRTAGLALTKRTLLPTELRRRSWPSRLRTWSISRVKAGRVCQFPQRPSRAPDRDRTCDHRLTKPLLCRLSYRGVVSSAGFEPALASISGWCLCRWATRTSEPQRGFEPRASRLRGGRSRRLSYGGLAGIPGFEPGYSWVRARRVCQFPYIPSSTGGGSRTRTSSRSPRFELGAAASYATPACAARVSNSVPRIKSPVHHQSCLQRVVGMTGLEPASSGPPDRRSRQTELHPGGAARRTGIPCLEGRHTSRCVSAALVSLRADFSRLRSDRFPALGGRHPAVAGAA